MIGDIPLLADVSKTEVVSPNMAKEVFGMLPGLVALTKTAGVTGDYRFFLVGVFEEERV